MGLQIFAIATEEEVKAYRPHCRRIRTTPDQGNGSGDATRRPIQGDGDGDETREEFGRVASHRDAGLYFQSLGRRRQVYLPKENHRQEYVMNESGLI
jgi:hypothetical protein